MITLTPRDNARTFRIAALEPVLTREFDGSFGGLRSAGGEVDAAVAPHPVRRERENTLSELFDDADVELRRVDVSQPRSLLGHRARYFFNAVADRDHCSPARSIQIAAAFRRVDETALSTARLRIRLEKISGKDCFVVHWVP